MIFFVNGKAILAGEYGNLNLYFTHNAEVGGGDLNHLLYSARMEYVRYSTEDSANTDYFNFQLTDGDGDVSSNTVAFSADSVEPDSPVTSIDQLTFREENLHNGAAPDYVDLVQNGSLTYNLPSGLSTLQIAYNGARYDIPATGYENLITDKGIFSVWHQTNAIGYSFILSDPLAQGGEFGTMRFEAILTDGNGQFYAGNDIFIHVFDDSPRILDTQTWTVSSDNPEASGNASECFIAGADGGVFAWKFEAFALEDAIRNFPPAPKRDRRETGLG